MILKTLRLRNILVIIGLITIILPFWSCYYDSKEFLYPTISTSCDTANITFSISVVNILDNKCLSCHNSSSAASAGGNINLDGYNNVKAKVDNGSFFGSISHTGNFSYMPKGSSKLDDCSISTVQKWINAGSPNN